MRSDCRVVLRSNALVQFGLCCTTIYLSKYTQTHLELYIITTSYYLIILLAIEAFSGEVEVNKRLVDMAIV